MDANVSVISRIAKTIETTVMIEAAMPPRSLEQLEDRCAKGKGSWAPVVGKQVGLFEPRKQRAPKPESESNGQRTNKETAAQVIRDVAERQSQAFDHKTAFRNASSDDIFHRIVVSQDRGVCRY